MIMLNTQMGVALLAFFSTSGCGLSSVVVSAGAAAAADDKQHSSRNNRLRRKRNLRKARHGNQKQHLVTKKQHGKKDAEDITEDVAFWTRMLQSSIPAIPPQPTPNPTMRPLTPRPQANVTPAPQPAFTDPPQSAPITPFPTNPPQSAPTDPPQTAPTTPFPTFPPQPAPTNPPVLAPTPPAGGGPVANDDFSSVNPDFGNEFISVLDNDVPAAGEELVVQSIVTNGSNGDCTISLDLSMVVYTPNVGFVGQDSCVYEACDGVPECATATLTLEVTDPLMVNQWMSLPLP